MNRTRLSTAHALSVAVLGSSMALAGCGGGGSAGATSGAERSGANPSSGAPGGSAGPVAPGRSDSEIGTTFCSAIQAVQDDLAPGTPSAAYLAQVTIKLDPTTTASLSAVDADRATKGKCPAAYQQFLTQAGISTLGELGLQP